MFILKHGTREDKPFLMYVAISVTGIDVSYSDERNALRFIPRAVEMQVGRALRDSFGNFYPVEVKGC